MFTGKINIWQILITAIVSGVITIGASMAVFKLQESEPKLTYSDTKTIPFAGSNGVIGIYGIKIANDGKKYVSDVVCVVRIPNSKIDQFQVSVSPANQHSEQVTGDTFMMKLSGLNPLEEAGISILVSANQTLPDQPEITLRATGINGTSRDSTQQEESGFSKLFPALVGLLGGLITLFLSLSGRIGSFSARHGADQRGVLAYLCGLYGLKDEQMYYRGFQAKVEYWSEADRLTDMAIESTDAQKAHSVIQTLLVLIDYASMASDSVAIVHYDIARLAAHLKDENLVTEHFRKARRLAPGLIKKRLDIDKTTRSLLSGQNGA